MDELDTLNFFKIINFIFSSQPELEYVSILDVFNYCRNDKSLLSSFYNNYYSINNFISFSNFKYFSSFKH